MVQKHRLAIFDLDGTLIHYEFEDFFNGAMRVLSKIGYAHVSREALQDHFAHFDFFGFVQEGERNTVEEQFWKLISREHYPSPREIDGAVNALGKLIEGGASVAIATARSTLPERLKRELRGTGLLPYIHLVGTKHGHSTPWWDKTEQLTGICREFDVAPENAFMVGDTPPDISSAKAIGLGTTVAVLSGGIHEHVLRAVDPDHLLAHVGEIVSLIETGKCRK